MKQPQYHSFVIDKDGKKKGVGKASVPKHEQQSTEQKNIKRDKK